LQSVHVVALMLRWNYCILNFSSCESKHLIICSLSILLESLRSVWFLELIARILSPVEEEFKKVSINKIVL